MQVGAGVADELRAKVPLVHENDAAPKLGARRSVAMALAPLAVAVTVAVQLWSPTAQFTAAAWQSPCATGGVGVIGGAGTGVGTGAGAGNEGVVGGVAEAGETGATGGLLIVTGGVVSAGLAVVLTPLVAAVTSAPLLTVGLDTVPPPHPTIKDTLASAAIFITD